MANDKRFIAKNGFASLGDSTVGSTVFAPQADLHILNAVADATATTLKIGSNGGAGNNIPRIELAESSSAGTMHYGFSITADGANTNNLLIRNHNNSNAGNVALSIDRDNANVGIGVTNPQYVLDVQSPANGFVTVGAASSMSVGSWSGIHFGYRENNTSYRKSAIVFERTDLTANDAQGKIHILNGPQGTAGSATLADAKITIAENGDVGIGTVTPNANFQVHGDNNRVTLSAATANLSAQHRLEFWEGSSVATSTDANFAIEYDGTTTYGGDGALLFRGYGASPNQVFAGWSRGGNSFLGLLGNVGIGTTNPTGKLEVYEASPATNTTVVIHNNSASHAAVFKARGERAGANQDVSQFLTDNSGKTIANIRGVTDTSVTDGRLEFWTAPSASNAVARMTVDSAGNVGIGTTSPSDKLEVSRTSTDQTVGLTLTNLQAGGYGSGIVWKSRRSDAPNNILDAAKIVVAGENAWNSDGNTASQMQFWTQKDNTLTKHMTLNKNGNLGISTDNPSSRLHIYDSTSTSGSATGSTLLTLDNYVGSDLSQQKTFIDFRLFDDNTNETPQVRIGAEVGANGDANTQILEGEGAFVVYTNDTTGSSGTATGLAERFRVDSPGNVGIGTNSPDGKLHVLGGLTKLEVQNVPNGVTGSNASALIEATEAQLQIMAVDTGSWASNITLTNAPVTGTNRHWTIHHAPATHPTNPNDLCFRYLATNTVGQIGGDGSGAASETKMIITSDGKVGIGTNVPATKLQVTRSATDASKRTIYADGTQLSAISTNGTNYLHNVWIENRNFDIDSGITDSGYRIGLNIEGYHDSSVFEGTLDTQKNIWSRNGNNVNGTGTITNSYNLHLETLSGGGVTITNNYGLYQSGAGTKNYFEGKVGIGTNMPGVALDLETPGNTTDGTFYSTFTINNTGTSTWSRIRFDRSGVARWGLALGTDDKFRISNLYTGGTSTSPDDNCIVIDNNSDVGIGTGNPTHRLHVLGDEAVRLYSATNGAGVHINFSDHAVGSYGQNGTLEYVHSDTQSFGSGNAFKFFGSETSMTLHVAGDIKATSDVTAYYSDPRLKDFHGTIPDALDKVNSLGGYYFTENARAKELGFTNDNMQVGVNAQEVEAVLPEVVTLAAIDDPENYKTVKYDKMVPLLIEAIKELSEQNMELKQRLDKLEGGV